MGLPRMLLAVLKNVMARNKNKIKFFDRQIWPNKNKKWDRNEFALRNLLSLSTTSHSKGSMWKGTLKTHSHIIRLTGKLLHGQSNLEWCSQESDPNL